MSVSIDSIFSQYRLPSGYHLLFLMLYTPIGIVLMTIRLFTCVQLFFAVTFLPHDTQIRKVMVRVLYAVLGLVVQEKNKHRKEKSRVIVANHATPFDHIALSLVHPCVSVSLYDLPGPILSLLCYKDFGVSQGIERLCANARTYINDPNTSSALLLHPEGATTNGKVALMKYGTWAFDISRSVQVVGLTANRLPIFPKTTILGASWFADVLFMFFSPVTIYNVIYIEKMTQGLEETSESFATRAQAATADALYLQVSRHSVHDKLEYVKRLAVEEAAAANPLMSPELHVRSMHVREILPHIPLEIIKRDLVRTRSISTTITNLLESYSPPTQQTSIPPSSSPKQTPSSVESTLNVSSSLLTPVEVNLNTSAKEFCRSADDRMKSFHDRKIHLIANARRKYIEKHNLQISEINC